MPLELVRQDITKMKVDAIVNAANTQLAMGGGVCGAIFRAAGVSRMAAACDRFAPIHTGEAVITPGFNLPSRYVIHTAGPIWRDGKHDEERLLRSCYRNSMELAARQGCASIAFPLISSGIYGYPKAEALHVALDEIRRFLGDAADSGHDLDLSLIRRRRIGPYLPASWTCRISWAIWVKRLSTRRRRQLHRRNPPGMWMMRCSPIWMNLLTSFS